MTTGLSDDLLPAPAPVPNPLVGREPELASRLAGFLPAAADHLLNALVARDGRAGDPRPPAHPVEDALAVVVVLRVLAKPAWTRADVAEFDAYWPAAWRSDLFGDEFEEARFRIQGAVAEAADQLAGPGPGSRRVCPSHFF